MKVRFTGKAAQNVAQLGNVKPNQTVQVSAEIGAALLRNAPDEWQAAAENTPLGGGEGDKKLVPAHTKGGGPANKLTPPATNPAPEGGPGDETAK